MKLSAENELVLLTSVQDEVFRTLLWMVIGVEKTWTALIWPFIEGILFCVLTNFSLHASINEGNLLYLTTIKWNSLYLCETKCYNVNSTDASLNNCKHIMVLLHSYQYLYGVLCTSSLFLSRLGRLRETALFFSRRTQQFCSTVTLIKNSQRSHVGKT